MQSTPGISEAGQTCSPSVPIRPNVERLPVLLQDVLLPHILGICANQLSRIGRDLVSRSSMICMA